MLLPLTPLKGGILVQKIQYSKKQALKNNTTYKTTNNGKPTTNSPSEPVPIYREGLGGHGLRGPLSRFRPGSSCRTRASRPTALSMLPKSKTDSESSRWRRGNCLFSRAEYYGIHLCRFVFQQLLDDAEQAWLRWWMKPPNSTSWALWECPWEKQPVFNAAVVFGRGEIRA